MKSFTLRVRKGEVNMTENINVGQKLQIARNKQELTQEHIAQQLQVSRQTISNWENNKSYPDIVSLITLS